MSLKEIARRDIATITQNVNEWAQTMVLHAPTGQSLSVTGLHTKHHLGIDAEKQKWANTPNAHISFTEQQLADAGYPYKNAGGEVSLNNHRVEVSDSEGISVQYRIEQWFPNKTIGLITCILGGWEDR